jgi:hypothetical protein
MLCDHIWFFVGTSHVAAWDSSPVTLATSIMVQRVLTLLRLQAVALVTFVDAAKL